MKKYLLIPLAALFLATGCATDEPPAPEVVPPRHTLIMYILDESRLHSSLTLNVEQVLSAVGTSFPESYSIYIYFDDIYKDPMLYRVVKPSKSGVQATLSTVKTYEKSFETASAANMKVVLQDVLDDEETPAETYGLLMSSHGSGWLPVGKEIFSPNIIGVDRTPQGDGISLIDETGLDKPEGSLTKGLGPSSSNSLSIADIADAMSVADFDYLMFDACFMASVEAMYELRNSVKYIMASPAEIMGSGFPMNTVIPAIFNKNTTVRGGLVRAANAFYNFYANYPNSNYASGSIAIIDCAEMQELADVVKDIYSEGLREVETSWVQVLQNKAGGDYTFHDLEDYLYHATTRSNLELFKAQLDKVLLYSETTPIIYSGYEGGFPFLTNGRVCGLSVFIPRTNGVFPQTTTNWYKTEWAKAIGATNPNP